MALLLVNCCRNSEISAEVAVGGRSGAAAGAGGAGWATLPVLRAA